MKCNYFQRFVVALLLLAGSVPLSFARAAAVTRGPSPHTGTDWQVSSQRPRLLVHSGRGLGRGSTPAELRARRLQRDRPDWVTLSANNEGWEGLLTPALRALVLGDLDRRAQIVNRLQQRTRPNNRSSGRQAGGHMAIAFDWLYDSLSEGERHTIAGNVANAADAALLFLRTDEPDITHNFTYMTLFTLVTAGLALSGVPGHEEDARLYLHEAQSWLEGRGGIYETCDALAGGWPEGTQYGYRENTRLLILMMHAIRSATNQDPFARVRRYHGDFVRKIARSYMAMTRPDMTLARNGDVNRYTPLLRDQHRFVIEAMAEGLRHDGGDPLVAGMLQHFSDLIHEAYGARDTHGNFQWGMLLFAHPEAPRAPLAYRNQPLLQVFGRGTLDLVVMRDGWDANATMITFIAGNHFVDHQHFDKGAFTLYHRGALLLDSGAYNSMYSKHHRNYASRTIAHNAPLIFDDARPLPPKYKADGGQLVLRKFQHHASWTEYEAHLQSEQLDAADLLCAASGNAEPLVQNGEREDTSPMPSASLAWRRYAVAQAELAGAYGGNVQTAVRTLAWFPAARVVIVEDRFAFKTALGVAFQVHSQSAPRAAGVSSTHPGINDLGDVSWWLIQRDGNLNLPKLKIAYDGRLFLRTLAPEKNRIRLVGGRGYQWFAANKNWSPGKAGNLPRESGKWRIEVHSAAAKRHEMIHVLQVAANGQFEMATSQQLDAGSSWSATHVASAPEVVLLVSRRTLPSEAQYSVDTNLPSLHVLVGLPRNRSFRILTPNGEQLLVSDTQGVLAFEDHSIGPHSLRITVE